MRFNLSDLLAGGGVLVVTFGVSMIHAPSAVIFFGVAMLVAGIVLAISRTRPVKE
jgi:hypothetical protein